MRDSSQGFTLIELLIVVALIGIITAVAVPILLRARASSNEASAIGSMRALVTAQITFESLANGYADDLATLAQTCPGMNAPFLSPDLNANGVVKNGYRFTTRAGMGATAGPADCFGNPTQTSYYASAVPISTVGGSRGFAANTGGAIWQDTSGAAPAEPFATSPTVTPLDQ